MTQAQQPPARVGWQPYHLDHYAQELVIQNRDKNDVLNESHKMRMSVAYGLERFWGEHLRLMKESPAKGKYWESVWDKLAVILNDSGITLPNEDIRSKQLDKFKKEQEESQNIKAMAHAIWSMSPSDQRVALMVLTQFCDALVWWTQRYKKKKQEG